MTEVLRWADLTRDELNDLAPRSVAVLPIGATEQHGPHLPTGTDHILANCIAVQGIEMATCAETLLLLPCLAFGSSGYHKPFGGTLSLSQATLRAVLADLAESLADAGVPALFVVNGHGGNVAAMQSLVQDETELSRLAVAAVSYWATDEAADATDGHVFGHAGVHETALMASVDIAHVRSQKIRQSPAVINLPPGGVVWGLPHEWERVDGFIGDPAGHLDVANDLRDRLAAGIAAAIDTFAAVCRTTGDRS